MIPLAKPVLGQQEIKAIGDVVRSGWVIEGPQVKAFETEFAAYVGAKHACAVSNCTTAMHLALLVSGVRHGDIVLTVSHSFIATASCVRHCGAEPVFIDIDPATYNMDPDGLERCLKEDCKRVGKNFYYKNVKKLLTPNSPLTHYGRKDIGRVSAILVVHQMGMPSDLTKILPIARRYGIKIVEDAACAIGSEISFNSGRSWQRVGRPHAGLACFSFHPRKIVTTGEGGMITTNDARLDKQLRLLRCHGRNMPAFARPTAGKVKFEDYVVTGYNYRMTDMQAAVGRAQLQRLPGIIESRRRLDRLYRKYLGGIQGIVLPFKPPYAQTNWQSYPVRIKGATAKRRNSLIQALLDCAIASQPGIMNTHTTPPYRRHKVHLPKSEQARDEVILLPFYIGLSEANVKQIAGIIHAWLQK